MEQNIKNAHQQKTATKIKWPENIDAEINKIKAKLFSFPIKEVGRCLEHKNIIFKCAGIRVLGDLKNKDYLDELIKLLDNKSNKLIRLEVIRTLGKIKDKSAVEPLLRLLNYEPLEIRVTSIMALAHIGSTYVIPYFIETLEDRDPRVRIATAEAFVILGDKRSIIHLKGKMLDPDEKVRKVAKRCINLLKYGQEAEPADLETPVTAPQTSQKTVPIKPVKPEIVAGEEVKELPEAKKATKQDKPAKKEPAKPVAPEKPEKDRDAIKKGISEIGGAKYLDDIPLEEPVISEELAQELNIPIQEVEEKKEPIIIEPEITDFTEDETELTEDETELAEDETEITEDETELTEDEIELAEDETDLAEDEIDLAEDKIDLAEDETDFAEDETDFAEDETDLIEYETGLAEYETELAEDETDLAESETDSAVDVSEIIDKEPLKTFEQIQQDEIETELELQEEAEEIEEALAGIDDIVEGMVEELLPEHKDDDEDYTDLYPDDFFDIELPEKPVEGVVPEEIEKPSDVHTTVEPEILDTEEEDIFEEDYDEVVSEEIEKPSDVHTTVEPEIPDTEEEDIFEEDYDEVVSEEIEKPSDVHTTIEPETLDKKSVKEFEDLDQAYKEMKSHRKESSLQPVAYGPDVPEDKQKTAEKEPEKQTDTAPDEKELKFIEMLSSKNLKDRKNGVKGLHNSKSLDALKALVKAASTDISWVRKEAIKSISNSPLEDKVGYLITFLSDSKWYIREESAKALGNMKSQRAYEPLTYLLEDENKWVQESSLRSLNMIDHKKTVKFAEQLLNSDHINVKSAAQGILNQK